MSFDKGVLCTWHPCSLALLLVVDGGESWLVTPCVPSIPNVGPA